MEQELYLFMNTAIFIICVLNLISEKDSKVQAWM